MNTTSVVFWSVVAFLTVAWTVLWTLGVVLYLLTRGTPEGEPNRRMLLSLLGSFVFMLVLVICWGRILL